MTGLTNKLLKDAFIPQVYRNARVPDLLLARYAYGAAGAGAPRRRRISA